MRTRSALKVALAGATQLQRSKAKMGLAWPRIASHGHGQRFVQDRFIAQLSRSLQGSFDNPSRVSCRNESNIFRIREFTRSSIRSGS